MEVKDLTYSANVGPDAGSKQRSLKTLPRVTPNPVESGQKSYSSGVSGSESSKAVAALSQADALVNDISDQAQTLNSYVKSLGGVIDQGLKETSEVRKGALAKEANVIFQAIRDKAVSLRQSETKGVSLDPLRSEVEAKIGRTLEILFPEDSTEQGGSLPELSFTNKDLIISVQTKILRTTQYLDALRSSDAKKDAETKEALDKAEVAQINAESSQTSLRDVDSAFKLVQETSKLIGDDSATALFAVGAIREQIDITG